MELVPENMKAEELRADAWRSLSVLFIYPADGLDGLREQMQALENQLRKLASTSADEIQRLVQLLRETDEQQFLTEFTRLFIGPFQTLAPPYGSYYLEEGRVMGESTMMVLNAYVEAGLKLHERYKDLPDHLAAEFEFLYFLLSNSVLLAEAGAEAESKEILRVYHEFLQGLLLPWIPDFCRRITDNTHLEFFHVLASALPSVVSDIHSALS
jgi:putative dimethyl sulfoxide reductase chaperone